MDFIEVEVVLDAETMVLLSRMTDVNLVQPPKASSPMLVTLLPMVMEVRPLQPSKALFPILVTLSPITYSFT